MIKSRAQWQAEHQVAVALARAEIDRQINFDYDSLPGPKWIYQGQRALAVQSAMIHMRNIIEQTYDRYRRAAEGKDIVVSLPIKIMDEREAKAYDEFCEEVLEKHHGMAGVAVSASVDDGYDYVSPYRLPSMSEQQHTKIKAIHQKWLKTAEPTFKQFERAVIRKIYDTQFPEKKYLRQYLNQTNEHIKP